MKKMLWIVNPHAGRGAMRGKLIDCILTFQEAGFDVTLHVTEGRRGCDPRCAGKSRGI